jgi:hypothetical protein
MWTRACGVSSIWIKKTRVFWSGVSRTGFTLQQSISNWNPGKPTRTSKPMADEPGAKPGAPARRKRWESLHKTGSCFGAFATEIQILKSMRQCQDKTTHTIGDGCQLNWLVLWRASTSCCRKLLKEKSTRWCAAENSKNYYGSIGRTGWFHSEQGKSVRTPGLRQSTGFIFSSRATGIKSGNLQSCAQGKARQNSCPADLSRNAHHEKSKANHGKYLGAETSCGMRVGIKSRDSSSGNRIWNSYWRTAAAINQRTELTEHTNLWVPTPAERGNGDRDAPCTGWDRTKSLTQVRALDRCATSASRNEETATAARRTDQRRSKRESRWIIKIVSRKADRALRRWDRQIEKLKPRKRNPTSRSERET